MHDAKILYDFFLMRAYCHLEIRKYKNNEDVSLQELTIHYLEGPLEHGETDRNR